MQHFLTLRDFEIQTLRHVIARAIQLKQLHRCGLDPQFMHGKVLAMLFCKASTRTRVSFEAACAQCGGHALFLSPEQMQLGRGESLTDTARVLSSMVDLILLRTHAHADAQSFAKHSQVPLINGLTDDHHPCQLLADLMTYEELRGEISSQRVAWIGDFNNMTKSYAQAAALWDFELAIACPAAYLPSDYAQWLNTHCRLFASPQEAVRDAALVVTDTWASMGMEAEHHARRQAFANYQVNAKLLDMANKKALFMHCLPAYRGEEISATLLSDPRACVWQEAENRLHAQKALMELLITN